MIAKEATWTQVLISEGVKSVTCNLEAASTADRITAAYARPDTPNERRWMIAENHSTVNRLHTGDCPFVLKDTNARIGVRPAQEDMETEGEHSRGVWVTDSNVTAFPKLLTAGMPSSMRFLLSPREADRVRCAGVLVVAWTRNASLYFNTRSPSSACSK